MNVEVKPIERKTWHNKTGKESFARPKTIQALVNKKKRVYDTGLDEKDIDKLKAAGIRADLSSAFDLENPHPFWDSKAATIQLENATQIFDTDLPMDFIKVSIMKASRFVANSQDEYDRGLFPEATHIIFDEVAQIEAKATKIQIKKNLIIKTSELDDQRLSNIVMIIAGKNLKGRNSNYISVEIDNIIENPKQARALSALLTNEPEFIAGKALVLEALQNSVLRKVGHKYLFMDDLLGNSVEEVVDYLARDDNQSYKMQIMDKLN